MQEKVKTTSSIRTIVAILLLLLIAATGGLVGYNYWFQGKQQAIKTHSANVDFSNTLEGTPKEMVAKSEELTLPASFSESDLHAVKSALMLIQIAAENLQTTKDVNGAQRLLKAAQDTLVAVNNPGLAEVIGMLAADQAKLTVLSSVDIKALIAKVNELDHMAITLPLKNSAAAAKEKKQKMQTQDKATKMQQALDAVLSQAKTVVKVRHKSEVDAETAQMNMEIQRAYVTVLLGQLRWAIYSRDNGVYQSDIQQLTEIAPKLYDDAQAFEQSLNEMAAIQVQADMPDIQQTIIALQAILAR